MKTRSIGVLGAATFATAASMFVTSAATAEVLGLMATTRLQSNGNYLINVFAVASVATDGILSVSGGQTGSITTTAAGGFLQGTGTQANFAPAGSQNWTTLDSFLTIGGSFLTASNAWTGNGSTGGDPNWNVTYTDSDTGESATVNAFNTASNETGFTNPYTNAVAPAGGWFISGTTSPARSLASLSSLNRQYFGAATAANSTLGMMIAQFYISGANPAATITFSNMRVFFNSENEAFNATIVIPAPGAVALLGLAGLAGRRRRA